jgi:hypothetical protein
MRFILPGEEKRFFIRKLQHDIPSLYNECSQQVCRKFAGYFYAGCADFGQLACHGIILTSPGS